MTQPFAHDALSAARLAERSANYNHVGMQRERILACLRQAGRGGGFPRDRNVHVMDAARGAQFSFVGQCVG